LSDVETSAGAEPGASGAAPGSSAPGSRTAETSTAPARQTWYLSRRLFLAGIALCYGVAFASLLVQVRGLFGAGGIQPLAAGLAAAAAGTPWWRAPSLLWFGASDAVLLALCWCGLALAALVVLGILPRLALALAWVAYLSFVSVGEPFLNFQWDALLLEAGFLAIFLAPGGVRPFGRDEREPSRVLLWLVRWLLFRLMLLSGVVKLASGDECWWKLGALDYHYWTQPLPHRLSHYVHWLPEWFQHVSVVLMFAVELGAPLLVFAPRRCKQIAAVAITSLMALIFATGNYGFFNLLTAVLCIPLVDDRAWRRLLRRPADPRAALEPELVERWRRAALGTLATVVFLLTSTISLLGVGLPAPSPLVSLYSLVAPFECFNTYGLFRVMTKERPEIVIEGSADGETWKPYRFRYKPLELERAPVFAGLHMPRLDWQLWFAALEHERDFRARRQAWYPQFLGRLLEGSEPVLALLAENPFPDAPPRFVRSTVFLYEFGSPAARSDGIWWRRSDPQTFFPTLTLVDGELRAVR